MEKLLPAQEAEMPKDFMPLEQVGLQPLEATVSFIGMVYDFLPPSITRGTDLSSSRDLKVKIWDGEKIALSSRSTSWTLFPLQEPPASSTWNKAHMFSISLPNTRVLPPEITYAQHLRRTLFNNFPIRPATSDTAMADSTAGSSALPPSAPRQKFCLIKDIEPEKYSDILGQVVKKYQPSNERIDLCVTDYTVNRLLYNHEWEGPSGGRDGDEYAYSNKSSSKWPGPHGKRVLLVTLWYPHLQFAADHVVIGDFVLLRNVHICLNSNGMLEGKLHQDKRYLEKILISKIRDKTDKRIIGVLQRRREYRDSLSKAQKEFLKLLESDEVFKAAAKSGAKPNGKARKKSRKQEESEQKEKLNFKSPEKNLSKY
ncbi:MAG: hypothetical protein M1829_006085, partial [Trizodia sp. TS-e1964]